MKICPNCGTQLDDNVQMCTYCGADQSQYQQMQYQQPQYPYQQPPYQQPLYQQPQYQQPQYQQPQYQQTMAPSNIGRTPVKTDYSLLTYFLLSILTCGIYGIYMLYKMAKDCNQICSEDGDSIGGLMAYILLSIITCGIYPLYWMYKIQNRLHAAAPRYNTYVPEDGGKVLLWLIVGSVICGIGSLIAFNIVFRSLNVVGSAYNSRYFYNRPQY